MASVAAIIPEVVQEARHFEYPQIIERDDIITELPKPACFNLVHIITGIRRCGKTFYAFQLINRLIQEGVDPNCIFYFNFSDDRLRPAPDSLMNDVVEEYWRQVPQARDNGTYLFLDEVQEAQDWQGFCQRIAEHEKVTLVITGSSSKLSSDEIATEFRGRSHEHPMRPLNFAEYCRFHEIETGGLEQASAVPPSTRVALESAYDRYLVEGGFPGVQKLDASSRIQMLQAYMRDVVARDVVERNPHIDISLANQTGLFCLRNTGCDLSINNLVTGLRDIGYKTSWDRINTVVRLFSQANLVNLLAEYSVSLAPNSTATQKVYAVDQGMTYAVSRANQQDVGKRFETAIFTELMKRTRNGRMDMVTSFTAPTKNREKVDFLIGDALLSEPYQLIQVSANMEAEKTRKRELGSLEVAMRTCGLNEGTIITLREEETVEIDSGTVKIVPAWKWALASSEL